MTTSEPNWMNYISAIERANNLRKTLDGLGFESAVTDLRVVMYDLAVAASASGRPNGTNHCAWAGEFVDRIVRGERLSVAIAAMLTNRSGS